MDKSKTEAKPSDAKRQYHSREFKIEAMRQLEEGKISGTQLALMPGVKRSIIYRGKKELAMHGPDVSFSGKGKTRTNEQTEIQRLKRQLAEVTEGRDIHKKSGIVLCAGTVVRYAFVRAHQQQFRVARLRRALQVSRSGYYEWLPCEPCAIQQEDVELLAAIEQTHRAYRQAYGAEKTWRALNASGVACGKHRVARLRRQAGIEALRKQRFRRLEKHSLLGPAPNRLERRFTVHCPNKVWVGDITVVSTRTGWLYLAVLLDLYSRSVVGWSMLDKRDRSLVIQALLMAMTKRKPQSGLMHHSDRGAQYSSTEYRAMLTGNGITISMSAKGDPYDNAVAESFFSNLKNKLTHHQVFHNREHARLAIFNYIEVFYNRQRIHQGLGYRTPAQVEAAVP